MGHNIYVSPWALMVLVTTLLLVRPYAGLVKAAPDINEMKILLLI